MALGFERTKRLTETPQRMINTIVREGRRGASSEGDILLEEDEVTISKINECEVFKGR